MNSNITQLSKLARNAVRSQDWQVVASCANSILRDNMNSAEGYFLTGLVERASNRPLKAVRAFEKTLQLDPNRYDAAIELANQYSVARKNTEVKNLLAKYEEHLSNSPMYLDLAGTVYVEIGLPEKAWPLYRKANELQPGVDLFQANLAACGVFLGKIAKAKNIYQSLLGRFPNHQRNHYQLARLEKATDTSHIDQMMNILENSNQPAEKNVFMYYAIGKELEDLGRWSESFSFYQKGGDAICKVTDYNIKQDLALIDKLIEVCDAEWLNQISPKVEDSYNAKTPIFIVGLPRTGTTLTERIISSHSKVESLGETQFLQMVLRQESGIQTIENMNQEMVSKLADVGPQKIAKGYMDAIEYRLNDECFFIDKLPFNFLFLGFIAKAWPNARIIHLKRNPMDACFSMYKQVFTWAYKYSYSLEELGKYYIAYNRLSNHWQNILKDRLIEVNYESLVSSPEVNIRQLLNDLDLNFEQSCLDFDHNTAPSATASSVQVREKAHSRSVNKWKHFQKELEPLKERLENAGIKVE